MGRPKNFDVDEALDKALWLFWRKGYAGTSLRDLLEVMSISRQSLYDTFGDKHRLFLRAMDRYDALPGQVALRGSLASGTGLQAIEAFFAALIASLYIPEGSQTCLMSLAALEIGQSDESVISCVKAHRQKMAASMTSALKEAQLLGQIDIEQGAAEAHAWVLVCLAQGLMVLAQGGEPRERLHDIVVRSLLLMRC